MTKERRLGRGLAALLGGSQEEDNSQAHPLADDQPIELRIVGEDHDEQHDDQHQQHSDNSHDGSSAGGHGQHVAAEQGHHHGGNSGERPSEGVGQLLLPIDQIDENPFQPRREFSEAEIVSLAESLKEHNLLQPVLVRRLGERYQLISGERRLRAARYAGWTSVPANLRDADDRLVAELAIVENLQRKDLNPIEKALAFKRYLDEHHCSQEDLASRIKANRSTIANLMRLLELPGAVQQALTSGHISAGHARALLPLGDENAQLDFSHRIQHEGWSVRDTERLVQERIEKEDGHTPVGGDGDGEAAKKKRRGKSDQVAALEQEFRMTLGTMVDIRTSKSGKGRIVVHFSSNEEFERLRGQLTGNEAHREAA